MHWNQISFQESLRNLTSLPKFNETLKDLYCDHNQLTSLPELNRNIKYLCCDYNNLSSLPKLNIKLKQLSCNNNELTSLPQLNKRLIELSCMNNNLSYLPQLNTNIELLNISGNPISEIINRQGADDDFIEIRRQIQKIINFRHLYFALKYKNQFRRWLWEKVREPKIIKRYHPSYLIENLNEDTDLDTLLNNW